MPRARSQAEYILEQLANVRRNIETLNRQVKQVSSHLYLCLGSIQLSIA
jgi:hypothetical protein